MCREDWPVGQGPRQRCVRRLRGRARFRPARARRLWKRRRRRSFVRTTDALRRRRRRRTVRGAAGRWPGNVLSARSVHFRARPQQRPAADAAGAASTWVRLWQLSRAAADEKRSYIDVEQMALYKAIDSDTAREFGLIVRATLLPNIQYVRRFNRFGSSRKMRRPPSTNRIFLGYLVVRKLGTSQQYETWMTTDVFESLYCELDENTPD